MSPPALTPLTPIAAPIAWGWKSEGVMVTLLDMVMGVKGFARVVVCLLCLVIGEVMVRSTNLVFV